MSLKEKIAGAVLATEYFLCYNNYDMLHPSASTERFRWLPIENSYFGNVPEITTAIFASEWAGEKIKQVGKRKNNQFIEKTGQHFSKIVSAATAGYYTLGESIAPYLLPGTADINDIPAVLITAVAAPIIGKYLHNKWQDNKKQIVQEIHTVSKEHEITSS